MKASTLLTVLGMAGLMAVLGCTTDDSGTGGAGGAGNVGNTGGSGGTGNVGNTGGSGGTGNVGNTGGSGGAGNTGGSGGTGGAAPECGNGVIEGSEVCDDDNTAPGDGCSDVCAVEAGFNCTTDDPSVCTPICGDFLLVAGEQCDDGNVAGGDGCSDACQFEATCGNGDVEPGEQCDDNNTADNDGCDSGCQLESATTCGDAVDLNDPLEVTIVDGVTVYSGDTTGSAITNFGNPSCSTGTGDVPTVVLRYTTSMPATVTVETVPVANSALTDTVVWAYLDCLDTAAELACNDDGGAANYSLFTTSELPAGTSVFIVVAGYDGTDLGPFELHVTEAPYEVVPASGTCNAPTVIDPTPGSHHYAGITLSADQATLDSTCAYEDGAVEAVYSLTLGAISDVTFHAAEGPDGYEIALYLLDACDGAANELECTGYPVGSPLFSLSEMAAGTYYVIVDGYWADQLGPYTLDVDIVELLDDGAACTPGDPAYRCEDGTACFGTLGAETCQAPLFYQDFTTALDPMTVVDSGSDAETWEWCDPDGVCSYSNYTESPSQGPFAMVADPSSGDVLDGEMLVTPVLNASAATVVTLDFYHYFDDYSSCDEAGVVEISVDGANWTAVATYSAADVTEHAVIDISAQAAGQAAFYVRFNYDDDTTGTNPCWANNWRVDDVTIIAY